MLHAGNATLFVQNKKFHKTLFELKKKYGPIFSLQLGWYPCVVLSNHELIKDAFVKHADQFSNRNIHMALWRVLRAGNKGSYIFSHKLQDKCMYYKSYKGNI